MTARSLADWETQQLLEGHQDTDRILNRLDAELASEQLELAESLAVQLTQHLEEQLKGARRLLASLRGAQGCED